MPFDLTPKDPQSYAFMICKVLLVVYVLFYLLLPAAISLSVTLMIYANREGSKGTFGIIRIAGMVAATVFAYIIMIKINKFIVPLFSDAGFLTRALLTWLQYLAIGAMSAIIGLVCSLNAFESDWEKIFVEGLTFVVTIFFVPILLEFLPWLAKAIAEHFNLI